MSVCRNIPISIFPMRFLLFTIIVFISLIGFNHGQNNMLNQQHKTSKVDFSKTEPKAMVSVCRPNGDRYCYLTEAIELIIFGERKNRTDLETLVNTIPDDETLNWFLLLGLQQLAIFGTENPTLVPSKLSIRKNYQ